MVVGQRYISLHCAEDLARLPNMTEPIECQQHTLVQLAYHHASMLSGAWSQGLINLMGSGWAACHPGDAYLVTVLLHLAPHICKLLSSFPCLSVSFCNSCCNACILSCLPFISGFLHLQNGHKFLSICHARVGDDRACYARACYAGGRHARSCHARVCHAAS